LAAEVWTANTSHVSSRANKAQFSVKLGTPVQSSDRMNSVNSWSVPSDDSVDSVVVSGTFDIPFHLQSVACEPLRRPLTCRGGIY